MFSYDTSSSVLDRDFDDIESFDAAMFAKSKWLKIDDGIWGCNQSKARNFSGVGSPSANEQVKMLLKKLRDDRNWRYSEFLTRIEEISKVEAVRAEKQQALKKKVLDAIYWFCDDL